MPVYGQLTYVPDDSFESYLESNGMGDGILDNDSVLTSAISSVVSLDVQSNNIYDLTGIEDFTLEIENESSTRLERNE